MFKNICDKRLDKIDELSKTVDDGELKSIISNSDTETDFSKSKDPVTSLDSTRKHEISIEEAQRKQKEFNRYLKKQELEINQKNKKIRWFILISFLTEETMLSNL